MNSPFSLQFPPGTMIREISPENVKKQIPAPVVYAPGRIYENQDFTIYQQYYHNLLTYIEFYHGQVKDDHLQVCLSCPNDTLFFIYLLEGSVVMKDHKGENVIEATQGQYYAHYIPQGQYNVILPSGRYSLFYFVLRVEWFAGTMEDSMIYSQVEGCLKQYPGQHCPLPVADITTEVKRLLLRLKQCHPVLSMKLDIQVLLILEKLLSLYDRHLRHGRNLPKSQQVLANILRMYIHQGILSGRPLNIAELADQLFTTPKTLQRYFKLAFDLSPQAYITQQKMEKAHDLILNTGHTLQEISDMLGYNLYSSFSRKFSSHFGHSPEQLRTGSVTDQKV